MTVGVIAIAVLIYFYIGNPDYSDQPHNIVQKKEQALKKLSTDELIAQYELGLQQKDTPEARLVLANMLTRLQRLDQAEKHFAAAYRMDNGKTPDIMLSYAEIIIKRHKDTITKHAKEIIDASLLKDPHNPRGLFYRGLFFAQNHDTPQAITVWRNLVKETSDKPYRAVIAQNLQSVIAQYNIMPEMLGLDKTQEITKDNLVMIEAMVKSLEEKVKANPNDKALKARLDRVHTEFDRIKQQFKD